MIVLDNDEKLHKFLKDGEPLWVRGMKYRAIDNPQRGTCKECCFYFLDNMGLEHRTNECIKNINNKCGGNVIIPFKEK